MYSKQSLVSYSTILKLSLCLLLGCSILGNDMYARKNDLANKIGDYINTLFSENATLKQEYIAAIKAKEYEKANRIINDMGKNKISDAQRKARRYLIYTKNAKAIYTWVSTHYLNSEEIWAYIQKKLQAMPADSDIYPYGYQLAHASLDKNASLQEVEAYLNELKNVLDSYRAMSAIKSDTATSFTDIATSKQYVTLENHIILHRLEHDLAIWKKQVKDLKKLLHSDLRILQGTDSATYSKVCAAADQLDTATMDSFLAEIKQKLQEREDAASDYVLEDGFVFDIEKVITTLENAINNKQIDDIPSAYRLALKHLLYMHPNSDMAGNPPTVPSAQIDELVTQMTAASQVTHTHNTANNDTANNSFSATSSKHITGLCGGALSFLVYEALTKQQLLGKRDTNASQTSPMSSRKSSKPPVSSKSVADWWATHPRNPSPKKHKVPSSKPSGEPTNPVNDPQKSDVASRVADRWKSLTRGKRAAVTAGALVTLGAGYQMYKKYFAKEKKASTAPVAPAFWSKNWLLFMLCLLLGGLLIAGSFYRKKTRV